MFQNRQQAGLLLAKRLKTYESRLDTLVLAIPRGGVVVGAAIAKQFNLPLAVVVVKKLGAPGNSELAIGAIAPDGIKVIDAPMALRLGVDQQYLDEEIERKKKEVQEREKKYKVQSFPPQRDPASGGTKFTVMNYKIIVLVDDGIATGATVQAALKYINHQKLTTHPSIPLRAGNSQLKTILAVPVIAKDSYDRLKSEVDELIALKVPESFGSVGQFYREFPQVSDEEVKKILE